MMLQTKRNYCYRQQRGFILVTTIWFLVITLLAASTFALWTHRSLNVVTKQSDATRALIDMHSTKATLLYLMATRKMNSAGLLTTLISSKNPKMIEDMGDVTEPITGNEIFVDGRAYLGLGLAKFSLQDEAGFINLNSPNQTMLKKLLVVNGLTDIESDGLIDKLIDYTDKDDFHRIQGAESYHYLQQNKLPPTNKPLNSELELHNVLGWHELLEKLPGLIDNFSVNAYSLINFNAANATILSLLNVVIQEEDIQTILSERNKKPFQSMIEAAQRTTLPLTQLMESVSTAPAKTLRISLWYDGAQIRHQTIIKLTPMSVENKPWHFISSSSRSNSANKTTLTISKTSAELLSSSD